MVDHIHQRLFLKQVNRVTKKTPKEVRKFKGDCVTGKKNKTKLVSDNTIEAEGVGNLFRKFG